MDLCRQYSVPKYDRSVTHISGLEIPKTKPTNKIISHTGSPLSFNDKHKQANWVAYELTSEETNKLFDRTDKFLTDPLIKSGTATDADYAGSGYDRGHFAPDPIWDGHLQPWPNPFITAI